MDLSEHFKIISTSNNTIHCFFEGFWGDFEASEIGEEFYNLCKKVIDSFEGKKFIVLVEQDQSFQLVSFKAQEYISLVMKYAVERNLIKAIEVTPDSVSRLGMNAAELKSGKADFREAYKTMEEAMRRINRLVTTHNLS